ncbi:MAG: glycosyltransferase family 39 protein [Endomicrobiales bacterium]|nr:glycosyltransferase family 39 protein [Endomicrobiales bacterium]
MKKCLKTLKSEYAVFLAVFLVLMVAEITVVLSYSNPDEFLELSGVQDLHFNATYGNYIMLTDGIFKPFGHFWYHPPLYHFISAVMLVLFKNNLLLTNVVHNGFYMGMGFIFTYLVGKRLKGHLNGIMAMIVLALYPATWMGLNNHFNDYPLMGLTAMSVYLLLRTDYFGNRAYSVLFALGCGWAMMVKWSFGAFIAGPLSYVLYVILRGPKDGTAGRLRNILISACVFAAVTAPFYCDSKKMLFILSNPFTEIIGEGIFSAGNLLYFLNTLHNEQLTASFALVLAGSFAAFLIKGVDKDKIVILFWIAVPFLVIFFMPHWKCFRYFIPMHPAFAIISACGLKSLVKWKSGAVLVVSIIVLGAVQAYALMDENTRISKIMHKSTLRYYVPPGEFIGNYRNQEKESVKEGKQLFAKLTHEFELSKGGDPLKIEQYFSAFRHPPILRNFDLYSLKTGIKIWYRGVFSVDETGNMTAYASGSRNFTEYGCVLVDDYLDGQYMPGMSEMKLARIQWWRTGGLIIKDDYTSDFRKKASMFYDYFNVNFRYCGIIHSYRDEKHDNSMNNIHLFKNINYSKGGGGS